MQKTTNEIQLLQACIAGKTEAFGAIVERYQSLVCAITYSATGEPGRSEELAQETFVHAWKNLGQLRDLDKFRMWLCTIARNIVRRSISKQRSDVINSAYPLEKAEAVATAESGPSEVVINKEQIAVVWRSLQNIPQTYREPLVLFYREQQSVQDVANGLGISADVARQRLSRGRKLLKAEVASLVGEVLGRTRPGKAFTIAVVAALPAAVPQAASAAAIAAGTKSSAVTKGAFAGALSGAVLGPLLGLLGGIFGSWMSIKNTKSARERKFMVKSTIIVWVLLILLIGLPLALAATGVIAKWLYWVSFAVFFVLLWPLISWGNARQRQIQKEEGTNIEPRYFPAQPSKATVYGAFGGSIFGSTAWIVPISLLTKDPIVVGVIGVAGLMFVISVRKCLHDDKTYYRVLIWDLVLLCAVNLLIVNLRWERWTAYMAENGRYLTYTQVPLWAMNLIIAGIFGGLLIMFALIGRKQRRFTQDGSNRPSEQTNR